MHVLFLRAACFPFQQKYGTYYMDDPLPGLQFKPIARPTTLYAVGVTGGLLVIVMFFAQHFERSLTLSLNTRSLKVKVSGCVYRDVKCVRVRGSMHSLDPSGSIRPYSVRCQLLK